jgi:predicted alpha/beta-hydrolase family hydrolase
MFSSMTETEIQVAGGDRTSLTIYLATAGDTPATLILAHGAGAGQRHPFMVSFAQGISARGIDVVTFNFVYLQRGRRVPDRMPQLMACYDSVIAFARDHVASARERLFLGGKSMGGRVGTHIAAVAAPASASNRPTLKGLVLLGYPLHPPGQPDKPRDAHLPNVRVPMLFVQGSRDAFGTPSELEAVFDRLSPRPTMRIVEGGDHSFKISGRDAARRQADVYVDVQDAIVAWIGQHAA